LIARKTKAGLKQLIILRNWGLYFLCGNHKCIIDRTIRDGIYRRKC